MEKTNLDNEFNKWKDKNESEIIDRWEAIKEDKLKDFIEELWQEYQNENGLIDESNEESLKDNSKDNNEYPYRE